MDKTHKGISDNTTTEINSNKHKW